MLARISSGITRPTPISNSMRDCCLSSEEATYPAPPPSINLAYFGIVFGSFEAAIFAIYIALASDIILSQQVFLHMAGYSCEETPQNDDLRGTGRLNKNGRSVTSQSVLSAQRRDGVNWLIISDNYRKLCIV